jgi:hypothetical protein
MITTTVTAIATQKMVDMEFVFPTTDYAKPIEFKYEHAEELKKVLAFLAEREEIIVHDDHNSGTDTRKLSAIVVLATGHICESFTTSRHCLNPVYIDDANNNLHLSTLSCAGNIYTTDDPKYYRNAIAEYNKGMLGWMPSKRIIAYKIF